MSEEGWDPDDVILVIQHPYTNFEKSLSEWMVEGPGPRNSRPVSARSKSTGEALPLAVIPLAYRNDRESQALIGAGKIPSPWPGRGGDPPAFDGHVASPEAADRLTESVLSALPQGPLNARGVREVLDKVPVFAEMASVLVRRLAGGARWAEFDAIIELIGAAGLVEAGPVLCDVLDSDVRPPNPEHVIEVLVRLKFDDAAQTLRRQLGQFVYANSDYVRARLCLHALAVMGKPRCRGVLTIISWSDWPPRIRDWAVQELEATGERIPPPF